VRDLVRRRQYMVRLRTVLKNKVHAEIATRWVKHDGDLFTEEGRAFLRSLSIAAVDDYLETIEFLDRKIRELGSGKVGAKLSRTNFYKTVLGRFLDLGLVAEDPVYDKEARKTVRAYRAVVQPVGSRRPLAPSLMYLAHVISERWNAELQSQGEEPPLQSG